MTRSRKPILMLGAVALALSVSGCSSDGGSTAGASPSGSAATIAKDDALAAMVPDSIKSDGVLLVGTDASYAPSQFLEADGKTIVGFDAELAKALGAVLGLEVDLQNAKFDSLVEGVKTGKYDLAQSSFTINAERQQQVDMVSYFNAGTSWATETGNPAGVNPDDACGKRIAVQTATVQVDDVTARSKACTDAGKPAITIDQYQLQSDATAAVVSGKDDGMLSDSPVIAFAVAQTAGKLEALGETYDSAPYGIAVPKDQGDYTKAVQGAMQKLMDTGAYLEILKAWGVESGAVSTAEVNPVK